MIVMLTRLCRSSWPRVGRPVAASFRPMCSDSDSTLISHRRTYLKRETRTDAKPFARQSDPLWTTMNSKDLLIETIQGAETMDQLLSIIDKHHSSFRQRHVKAAFHLLKVLYRPGEDVTKITDLPQFHLLCKETLKLMRTFNAKELLSILGRLVDFRVPPKALIFQSSVQMIRQMISDLHTDSLLLLDHIVNSDIDKKHPADTDATVVALRIALPMVLEIRLSNNEYDASDLSVLIPSLRVAVTRQLSDHLINKLMLLIKEQSDHLTFYHHLKIISTLTSPRITADRDVDLQLADEIVIHCLQQFTKLVQTWDWTWQSEETVIDVFNKSFEGRKTFYSKDFFELVVDVHLRRGTGTTRLVKVAKNMLSYDHVSMDLISHIADKLSREKLHVDFDTDFAIGALQPLIVLSGYEPPCGWDQIIDNLYDNDMMAEAAVKLTFQYLKILESMAMISRYSDAFYSHMMDALTTMSTRPVPLGTVGQRLLNISLGLGYDDTGLPPEKVSVIRHQLLPFVQESIRVLNPIRKHSTEASSSLLRDSLVKALGGEDFMRCGIWSESGHYHDYIVVMRKGDYPVAIGKEILELDFLENIKLPDECKLLSIVALTNEDFLRQPPQMYRRTSFRIEMLQKSGFHVLPLNMTDLEEMPKRELIPFLMREITDAIKEQK